jgi:preprotein translocase subunit YajC
VNLKAMFAIVLLVAVSLFYFMIKSNKESSERIKQAGITHQQKLEQEKYDAIQYEKDAAARQIARENERNLKAEEIRLNAARQDKKFKDVQSERAFEIQMKKDKLARFMKITNNWAHASIIADSADQLALGNHVADLKEIRDELQEEEFYDCLIPAKLDLSEAMDLAIFNYVYFMQNSAAASVKQKEEMKYYNKMASALKKYNRCKHAF